MHKMTNGQDCKISMHQSGIGEAQHSALGLGWHSPTRTLFHDAVLQGSDCPQSLRRQRCPFWELIRLCIGYTDDYRPLQALCRGGVEFLKSPSTWKRNTSVFRSVLQRNRCIILENHVLICANLVTTSLVRRVRRGLMGYASISWHTLMHLWGASAPPRCD